MRADQRGVEVQGEPLWCRSPRPCPLARISEHTEPLGRDRGDDSPGGRRRCHLAGQLGLLAQHAQVGQAVAAVRDCHDQVPYHPTPLQIVRSADGAVAGNDALHVERAHLAEDATELPGVAVSGQWHDDQPPLEQYVRVDAVQSGQLGQEVPGFRHGPRGGLADRLVRRFADLGIRRPVSRSAAWQRAVPAAA